MNIKLVGRINLLTLFIAIVSLFIASSLFSAEGGPCKDYGPCDEFQPELNNLESLQRVQVFILINVMVVIPFNIHDGEELLMT